mmetsp:Transcript_18931/g.26054  ORF Transcript_18931/g.26054 Transcript_18931/m.26054 type:complete len:108 (-) Transcript_18931:628-951(-)
MTPTKKQPSNQAKLKEYPYCCYLITWSFFEDLAVQFSSSMHGETARIKKGKEQPRKPQDIPTSELPTAKPTSKTSTHQYHIKLKANQTQDRNWEKELLWGSVEHIYK